MGPEPNAVFLMQNEATEKKMKDIVVLDGVRTAIGTFGGALANTSPIELGEIVAKEAIARSGIDGRQIENVVFGHVINTEPRDMYLSRAVAIGSGVPEEAPAMNVNRLCGSGLQAIVSAAQSLMQGDAAIALAGGSESMSRSPYIMPAIRWDARGTQLSVWHRAYGGHGGKCCLRICNYPRGSRRVCTAKSGARPERDQ
jgi:acetyl-CoA acetyltransferase